MRVQSSLSIFELQYVSPEAVEHRSDRNELPRRSRSIYLCANLFRVDWELILHTLLIKERVTLNRTDGDLARGDC